MRYVVAIVASMLMLGITWFLSGLVLLLVLPREWSQMEFGIGGLQGNLASILAIVPAGLVATHTLRASLKAKTGRLYRRRETNPESRV